MRAQAREAKQIGEGLGDGALVAIHRLSQTLDFKVIDEKKKKDKRRHHIQNQAKDEPWPLSVLFL